MKKIFPLIILILFGSALVYLTQEHLARFDYEMSDSFSQISETHLLSDSILSRLKKEDMTIYSVLAGGDIMLDRGVESKIRENGGDYNFIFNEIRDDLNEADLVFANLEGSLSDVGADTGKKYSFRFEVESAEALANAGIDIVSLANNHMLDWGRNSLCETTKHLEYHNISYVGAGCDSEEAERTYITRLGDTRIAFLAYTEFYLGAHATESRAGMSEFDMEKIVKRISSIKEQDLADLIFVSMHAGEEYKLRSNTFQQETYHAFIDAGADVVIGHHPHVVQEIERYAHGWIIYSLGNFVFDQYFSEETMRGLLADIQVQNKRIYDVVPLPIQLNTNYQPSLVN